MGLFLCLASKEKPRWLWEAGSSHRTIFLGRDGPPTRGSLQIPDELRFRVHVAHTVLCKPLVQTVECGSQEAPNDPHHDEETQIHSCPEMTFFIRVRALREGGREGERKTRVAMRTGREETETEQERTPSFLPSLPRVPVAQLTAHGSRPVQERPSSPLLSYLRASFTGTVKYPGREDKTYLKFTKVQQSRQLEGTPTSKLNPRAEEVEGEGGRHGTEELEDR